MEEAPPNTMETSTDDPAPSNLPNSTAVVEQHPTRVSFPRKPISVALPDMPISMAASQPNPTERGRPRELMSRESTLLSDPPSQRPCIRRMPSFRHRGYQNPSSTTSAALTTYRTLPTNIPTQAHRPAWSVAASTTSQGELFSQYPPNPSRRDPSPDMTPWQALVSRVWNRIRTLKARLHIHRPADASHNVLTIDDNAPRPESISYVMHVEVVTPPLESDIPPPTLGINETHPEESQSSVSIDSVMDPRPSRKWQCSGPMRSRSSSSSDRGGYTNGAPHPSRARRR
jgi:hypothetical protein